jgi:hypothetical protein
MNLNAPQLRRLSKLFAQMADLAQEADELLARPVEIDVSHVFAKAEPAKDAAKPAPHVARNLPAPEFPWTPEEIERAIAVVVETMAAGKSKSEGYRAAAAEVGRSANAVQVRLRGHDGDRLNAAIAAAGIVSAPKHIAGDAPAGTAGGAWTEAEDEAIRAAIRDNPHLSVNATGKLLAQTLDRTAGAIAFRIGRVILPAMAPKAEKPAPTQKVETVPGLSVPMEDSLPRWQKDLRAALNALPHAPGFDAEVDLELVEGLCLGRKLVQLAADLEVDQTAAVERWKILRDAASPDRPFGMSEQERLIAELHARVVFARAAA